MEVALNNKTWKSSLRVLAGLAAQLLWVVRCHVREVSHDVYEGVVTRVAKLVPPNLFIELCKAEHGHNVRVGIFHRYLEGCRTVLVLRVLVCTVFQQQAHLASVSKEGGHMEGSSSTGVCIVGFGTIQE